MGLLERLVDKLRVQPPDEVIGDTVTFIKEIAEATQEVTRVLVLKSYEIILYRWILCLTSAMLSTVGLLRPTSWTVTVLLWPRIDHRVPRPRLQSDVQYIMCSMVFSIIYKYIFCRLTSVLATALLAALATALATA